MTTIDKNPKSKKTFNIFRVIAVLLGLSIPLYILALPSMLSGANRAKESEAKFKVKSLINAQQSYYQSNQRFTTTMTALQSHAKEGEILSSEVTKQNGLTSRNYQFLIRPVVNNSVVQIVAWRKEPQKWPRKTLKNYVGIVWSDRKPNSVKTTSIDTTSMRLCEQASDSSTEPEAASLTIGSAPSCPQGYNVVLEEIKES